MLSGATRYWFIIIYVPGTNRQKITLYERSSAKLTDCDSDFDYASRKEFEYYILPDSDERKNYLSEKLEAEDKENEAANYARELAAKHGLEFVGESNTDGILD